MSDADTSDRTNTAAAFEFLREIEERKRNAAENDDEMDAADADNNGEHKIVFKQRRRPDLAARFNQSVHLKSQLEGNTLVEDKEKPVLKGSKVVMPEYVIGQKVAKGKSVKQRPAVKVDRNQLKLGHLFDEEEDN